MPKSSVKIFTTTDVSPYFMVRNTMPFVLWIIPQTPKGALVY